jgi:5'-deoxynucleotidase
MVELKNLMNCKIKMTMRDVYRTSEVTRWHMVRTRKEQSVAEHSFLVAMIAMRACEIMGLTNSIQVGYIIQKALFHDLPEVYTGDVATPFKRNMLNAKAETKLEDFEHSIWFAGYSVQPNFDQYKAQTSDIVKLADTVEAIVFLDTYGEGPYALGAMAELMRVAYIRWPGIAETLVYEMTCGTIKTLESVLNET